VVIGTTNSAVVDPVSVLQPVLLLNAIDFIIVHNHPSGSCEPSEYDYATTKRMREAGDLIGLRMTDHLVMGERQFWSFTKNRRLNLKEE
jgi:DNA repair protein RadC